MKRTKRDVNVIAISREEELKLMLAYEEAHGVTKLPPDERLADPPNWSAWKRSYKPTKKKKKKENKNA